MPCVVKLFASTDRVTRARLLTTLVHFVGHLQPQVVNDQIFPNVALGFLDTNPYIRDQTIESIIHLAPKLNYNNLNVEVLRHFARLQAKDEQGGIRTNTTVCLGNIAKHLHPQVRQRVLVSAFMRAIKDAFAPARGAGVLALATTQQYFLLSEVAHRILPALCTLTVDPDKTVREHTFKTLRGFLGKLERVSEDPSLRERMGELRVLLLSSLWYNIMQLHGFRFRRGRCAHGNTVAGQCGRHVGRLGGDGRHGEILPQPERFGEAADAYFGRRQGAE